MNQHLRRQDSSANKRKALEHMGTTFMVRNVAGYLPAMGQQMFAHFLQVLLTRSGVFKFHTDCFHTASHHTPMDECVRFDTVMNGHMSASDRPLGAALRRFWCGVLQ